MDLQCTPLRPLHESLGARMTRFAGWEMPLHYGGILAEHRAVRTRAGLFDLSHMGEIEIRGRKGLEVCQELLAADVARLRDRQARYAVLCYADGGIVDDVVLYRCDDETYLFCVNAANTDKDLQWMRERAGGRAAVVDRSRHYVLLALQGPKAEAILQGLTPLDLPRLGRFWSAEADVAGVRTLVARTGYTGEDGFELFIPAQAGAQVWLACMGAGEAHGLRPCGLGARDTLRLEAGLVLYGNDITGSTTPLEAGLDWTVHLDKGDFSGREALLRQKGQGVGRRLVGLELLEAGIARAGYPIFAGGRRVGRVTSGCMSPTLGKAIAMGYVVAEHGAAGSRLEVEIRGRRVAGRVVPRPFYRRGSQTNSLG